MKKENKKKKSGQLNLQGISINEMIHIHEEAYYRALIRVQSNNEKNMNECYTNDPWYINLLFILNVIFVPWRIYKKFPLRENMYDSVLVVAVTFVLQIFGNLIWMIGIVYLCTMIKTIETVVQLLQVIFFSLVILMIGSILILAGKQFKKENDSFKIYAYSASIIALISLFISVFSLFK